MKKENPKERALREAKEKKSTMEKNRFKYATSRYHARHSGTVDSEEMARRRKEFFGY